jgi:hypothetical protein
MQVAQDSIEVDPRRSTAIEQLAHMAALKLVAEDEIARFNPDTREIVRFLTGQ